jgi:hypothetical protein
MNLFSSPNLLLSRERFRARAFQQAYALFRERHPEWADSLFDQPFLERRIASLLKDDLVLPTGLSLASWWADHLGLGDRQRAYWVSRLTPAASDFLHLLQAALRQPEPVAPLLRPQG